MKISNVIFWILVVLILIPTNSSPTVVAKVSDFGPYLGYSACLANDVKFDVSPEVTPSPLCSCNGTGKVSTGDGLEQITCPCGDNCTCKSVDGNKCKCGCGKTDCHCGKTAASSCAAPNDKPIYFCYDFIAKWCQPCKNFNDNEKPKLEKREWKFVKDNWESGCQVVQIDVDEHPDIYAKYVTNFLPGFVIVKDGVKIASKTGFMNHIEFATWYNDVVTKDKGK